MTLGSREADPQMIVTMKSHGRLDSLVAEAIVVYLTWRLSQSSVGVARSCTSIRTLSGKAIGTDRATECALKQRHVNSNGKGLDALATYSLLGWKVEALGFTYEN